MDTQDEAVGNGSGRGEVRMMHRFRVGQSVLLRLEAAERQDVYEVIRCLPSWPDSEPMYRLRSTTNRSERVVRESEIRSVDHGRHPS